MILRPEDGPQLPKHVVIIINLVKFSCVMTWPPSLICIEHNGDHAANGYKLWSSSLSNSTHFSRSYTYSPPPISLSLTRILLHPLLSLSHVFSSTHLPLTHTYSPPPISLSVTRILLHPSPSLSYIHLLLNHEGSKRCYRNVRRQTATPNIKILMYLKNDKFRNNSK